MQHSLRVVTWNVWGRYGPWRERAPLITETLGRHTAFARTWMPEVEPGWGADGLGMAGRWPVLGQDAGDVRLAQCAAVAAASARPHPDSDAAALIVGLR